MDMVRTKIPVKYFLITILLMAIFSLAPAQQPVVVHLWPAGVPGETKPKAADVISDDHGGNVTRIARVTDPVIEVFEPKDGKFAMRVEATGANPSSKGAKYFCGLDCVVASEP